MGNLGVAIAARRTESIPAKRTMTHSTIHSTSAHSAAAHPVRVRRASIARRAAVHATIVAVSARASSHRVRRRRYSEYVDPGEDDVTIVRRSGDSPASRWTRWATKRARWSRSIRPRAASSTIVESEDGVFRRLRAVLDDQAVRRPRRTAGRRHHARHHDSSRAPPLHGPHRGHGALEQRIFRSGRLAARLRSRDQSTTSCSASASASATIFPRSSPARAGRAAVVRRRRAHVELRRRHPHHAISAGVAGGHARERRHAVLPAISAHR